MPKNIGGTSKYIGFFDECGDHAMSKIDKDFPLFVLALIIVERQAYSEHILSMVNRLKLKYWNHEGVNLHSRDIRKQKGPYSFLRDNHKYIDFMEEIGEFVDSLTFTLFITGINKEKHLKWHGSNARNPYHVALAFTMERVLHFMESNDETELPLIAEARGEKENQELEREFYKIMTMGTKQTASEGFKKLTCPLVFKSKKHNIAGIQIADLCAHPCARYILKPEQDNRAYDIVSSKMYSNKISGLKVFP